MIGQHLIRSLLCICLLWGELAPGHTKLLITLTSLASAMAETASLFAKRLTSDDSDEDDDDATRSWSRTESLQEF